MPCMSTSLALRAPLSPFSIFSYLTTTHSLSSPISKNRSASKNKCTQPGDGDDDDDSIHVEPTVIPPASHTDIGVEDNGNDEEEEMVKDVAEEVVQDVAEEVVQDVAEEVEGCRSGGRDDNVARQGIHWIVVRDEINPENNDLRKWQCNVGSCHVLYASKLKLREHLMATHAFGEVEAGMKGRPKKMVANTYENLNHPLHNTSEEVEGCSSGGRDGNLARQGVHWIVVWDEMDPENNYLRRWQCTMGSCRASYVSKMRLRGHLMAIHAFREVEEGMKGRPRKAGGRVHKNDNYTLRNARVLSNPVERLARNESKARTRVEASSLRTWRKMVLWMSEHGSFKPPFLARLFKGAHTLEFFGIPYWGEGKLTIEKFKSFKCNKKAVAIIRNCKESWALADGDAWAEEDWATAENTEKRQIHLDELINYHTHAKYKIMYDHHTEESYIEECWNHLKRRRVLEEPLRVDACIQSSKRYRTMAETLASKDADNSD